ncbi:hypothetical protein XELAEV_18027054mg [Xenopus laevis]|uniref:G-protein coupled receptors family 1 profile domain-containing protein n=1 Tax=Xenopus laevis TaxID=8355 RepID=A0A974HJM1_XENLA|nr:hypothetical protein XELAEV_18027054mg [Xenopus laevis]
MDIQTSSAVLWTCVKASAIWIISMLLAVPEAVFSEVAHINESDNVSFTACIPYPQNDEMHPKIHSVLIFLVYYLIPLTIISIYYYHIARTLIKSAHNIPGEYSEHSKRQNDAMMDTPSKKTQFLATFLFSDGLIYSPGANSRQICAIRRQRINSRNECTTKIRRRQKNGRRRQKRDAGPFHELFAVLREIREFFGDAKWRKFAHHYSYFI